MQIEQSFELLACGLSSVALAYVCFRPSPKILKNRLFLPLYTAGMVQWALFGFWSQNPVVGWTSLLQVSLCAWLLRVWVRTIRI